MSGYCRYDDHEALLGRMAGTLGVDLEGDSQSGRLTPAEMAATVYRCMSCEEPEECRLWLEGQGAQGAEAAPPYCRNQVWLGTRRRG